MDVDSTPIGQIRWNVLKDHAVVVENHSQECSGIATAILRTNPYVKATSPSGTLVDSDTVIAPYLYLTGMEYLDIGRTLENIALAMEGDAAGCDGPTAQRKPLKTSNARLSSGRPLVNHRFVRAHWHP